VRLHSEAALLLVFGCYFALFCLNKQGLFATPRYLFPLYSAVPLLASQIARLAALPLPGGRDARATSTPPALRVGLGAVALAALLAWNVAGDVAATPLQTAARDHGVWIAGTDQQVLALLHAHQVHTVISNDYWEGLRLTFESGETIITVMLTPEGHPGFNRYPPYVAAGLADPRPAYLELSGTREEALQRARMEAGLLPGYQSIIVGVFTLILPP
jgi:hypothetical protein